jgi:hypothetical protein
VSTWYAERKYVQQCATTATVTADASQDVVLTSLENLAIGNSLQPPRVPGTRTVSGIVFEVTEAGRKPVENATVGFESDLDFIGAWTFTDASGRYLLCSLPETRLTLFVTRQPGQFPSQVSSPIVPAGSDTTLDIEAPPR